jgi:Sortase (surface protein transpeptidase)
MWTKQRSMFVLAFVVVILSIGGGVLAWRGVLSWQNMLHYQSPQATPGKQISSPQTNSQRLNIQAARLIIPAIGIDAPIEAVGRDASGHLGVPTKHRWDGVAWYQEGPVPGQLGSSVIDGHLDKVGGAPAIFWNLHKLRVGDMVSVRDKQDHVLHFQVTKVSNYRPDAAPLGQIFGETDGSYLNLITCSGNWSFEENQYLQRLVIFTRLVS